MKREEMKIKHLMFVGFELEMSVWILGFKESPYRYKYAIIVCIYLYMYTLHLFPHPNSRIMTPQ